MRAGGKRYKEAMYKSRKENRHQMCVISTYVKIHQLGTDSSCYIKGIIKIHQLGTDSSCYIKGIIKIHQLGTDSSCYIKGIKKSDLIDTCKFPIDTCKLLP